MADQRPLICDLQKSIQDILLKHDPLGLINFGAPYDEYSPESQTIAPQLRTHMSIDDISVIVHAEFVKWFNKKLAGGCEKYVDIATDIYMVLGKTQDN